jgi:hypothetical protein
MLPYVIHKLDKIRIIEKGKLSVRVGRKAIGSLRQRDSQLPIMDNIIKRAYSTDRIGLFY